MNIERFRKIMEYSAANREEIEKKMMRFYSYLGISSDKDVLNILQVVRPTLERKGYLVLEIPFADDEIGALCYKKDAWGYIVMNTSLPKMNVNFAVCHEVYHVFFSEQESGSKVEFTDGYYFEHEEEYAANLFAGMLLMPETNFRQMYTFFWNESEGNERDTVIRLMSYYRVPYMAALIRCYELGLPKKFCISEELLNVDGDYIRDRFAWLWLDESVLEATNKDDYAHIEAMVARCGKEYIQDGYLNERTLKKALQNMKTLYSEIKGE